LKEYLTLAEIQRDLREEGLTCVKLVEHYLGKIEANKHLNAFVEVYTEEAKKAALAVDAKIVDGTAGRLAGMVIGLKDVLSLTGHGLQAGSQILQNYKAPYTATAVQRLIDEDAIIIGRQNCDEFAMGSSNENSSFGPVLNAINNAKVPGGSSGGSAVAVQAGLCHASLGSDTGGSVRQPAAFCGVIGVKPSYGRVSRYGLIAYASSFDCIGPITKSIADAALILEVMSGADDLDSTVSERPVPAILLVWNGKAKPRSGTSAMRWRMKPLRRKSVGRLPICSTASVRKATKLWASICRCWIRFYLPIIFLPPRKQVRTCRVSTACGTVTAALNP
jgi:aspartyl-tRNA(Asn)/glutamyl-tRNA(Gln) amidotransferase subunit A